MSKQVLAASAVLWFVLGAAWWLFSRTRPQPLKAPAIVDVVRLDSSGIPKATSGELTLQRGEALSFNVQLQEPAWVYVYRATRGKADLEWWPDPVAKKLEAGVWAPDWQDIQGIHFPEGDATLYVLASPERIEDARLWTTADLATPELRCPRCGITSLEVRVAAPQ